MSAFSFTNLHLFITFLKKTKYLVRLIKGLSSDALVIVYSERHSNEFARLT